MKDKLIYLQKSDTYNIKFTTSLKLSIDNLLYPNFNHAVTSTGHRKSVVYDFHNSKDFIRSLYSVLENQNSGLISDVQISQNDGPYFNVDYYNLADIILNYGK